MSAVRPISLHQIIAPELLPADLVRTAAKVGCRYVCVSTQRPPASRGFPIVGDDGRAAVRAAMDATGRTAFVVTHFHGATEYATK